MKGRLKKERTSLNPRQQRTVDAIVKTLAADRPTDLYVDIVIVSGDAGDNRLATQSWDAEAWQVWRSTRSHDGCMKLTREGYVFRCNIIADEGDRVNRRPLLPKMADAVVAAFLAGGE